MIRVICVLSMISMMACGPDDEDDPSEGVKHPDKHVLIWVDPESTLPQEEMLAGCDAWFESGVGCELVTEREASDVQIFADTSGCTPRSDGSVTLAYAACCGPIVFFSECFKHKDGSWDLDALVTVAAHEIGHQFGLWWHVNRTCINPPEHPSGKLVCGKAIMNPYYDSNVDSPTEIDGLAFDVREASHSVVDFRNHHANDTQETPAFACEYTTRP